MGAMNEDNEEPRLAKQPPEEEVPTIPVSEKVSRTSVSLPDEMWEDMAETARALSDRAKREGRRPFTRDDLIAHAWRWWRKALGAELQKPRKD